MKDRGLLADLGERSGDIALQCSETAGFLGDVDRRIQKDAAHLDDLQVNMRRLSASQGESMAAARELSLTAQRAEQIIAGAAADIHPPGYYFALAGWRALAGWSEFSLRGFSAFAGLLLVALLIRLGTDWFGSRAGLFAAAHEGGEIHQSLPDYRAPI